MLGHINEQKHGYSASEVKKNALPGNYKIEEKG